MRWSVLAILAAFISGSCGNMPERSAGSTSSSAALQHELDINPALKRLNITARVGDYNEGYVTIILGGPGLDPDFKRHLLQPDGLRNAIMGIGVPSDQKRAVNDLDEILRKRSDVKAVEWKAEP